MRSFRRPLVFFCALLLTVPLVRAGEPLEIEWRTVNQTPIVSVELGTPGQVFDLGLLVDANYLWVFDSMCMSEECSGGYRPANFYNPKLSSTVNEENITFNGVDDGTGFMFNDLFSIAESGLSFRQSFAAVDHVVRAGERVDGVLGLSGGMGEQAFIRALTAQRNSSVLMLSMDFESRLFEDRSGSLTVAPVLDPTKKVDLVPTLNEKSWWFAIKRASISLRSHQFKVDEDVGTIRLGSPYTVGPYFIVELIFHIVEAVPFGDDNHFYVLKSRVKKIPTVWFELENGGRFELTAEDMLFEDNPEQARELTGRSDVRIFALESGLQQSGDSPSWLFGENFLRRHSVLLDAGEKPRIGFFVSASSSLSAPFLLLSVLLVCLRL